MGYSLHDDRLTAADLNLSNSNGEGKRIVEAETVGFFRGARIVTHDLLQQHLRDRQTADARGLQRKPPDALAVRQHARRSDRQPADQKGLRVEQAFSVR